MSQLKLVKELFVSLIFLGLFSVSSAQVIEGDVILSTQAEVNSFAGTSITGNLTIHGSDIVDLTPLSTLTSVGGLYVPNNAALTNLDGLGNITSVGWVLYVQNNDALTNLDGLGNITSVGWFLHIFDNAVLTNLDGLSNLTYAGNDLAVYDNGSLNIFCGLYPLLSSNGLQGSYTVADNLVNPTQQQIIDNGPCVPSALSENELLAKDYNLHQNYPNPFNPITTISYEIPEQAEVSLTVYDVRGQELTALQDGVKTPGNYEVQWNGTNNSGNPVSTGVYFARLQAGSYSKTIKMVYLR